MKSTVCFQIPEDWLNVKVLYPSDDSLKTCLIQSIKTNDHLEILSLAC